MRSKRVVQTLMTAAAIPAIVVSVSPQAFAGSGITWTDAHTGYCLEYTTDFFGNLVEVQTNSCGGGNQDWADYQNSDGSWFEKAGGKNVCLTMYSDHDVYLEGCKGNDWERWYEERQSNGHWKLRNKATGWYLDSNSNHQVYGEPANGGDYQEWK
ncbi:RICIN domain-containing protein [Streptomyces aureus]|uniref:RICIN domain-containing protein n=1 Tax=Streptomyces aureus TaxID=193461 RepID=UPI00131BCF42|nr:ricin-type beta-trefoil lectin domain protein [Streptomyces aureus]